MDIPDTYNGLKKLDRSELNTIWEHLFKNQAIPANTSSLLRPLWYKIQCERNKLKLEQRHITRLNTYAANPDDCVERAHKTKYRLKPGTQIVKSFNGKEYLVHVDTPSQFSYDECVYKSLSAIATQICGHKVSGYDFFGLANKAGGNMNYKN
ncbi:MAG: DUF2924 domain-containing protein [Alphaproteobacteria bacterium]|nr:DUF2924 domain-containing protein [Alphaproteobacteria bacterium]